MTDLTKGAGPQDAAGLGRFTVRQRVTLMVNRYEIQRVDAAGNEAGMLAFAEQKRFAFKEQVTFYADASKTVPVFGFKARKRIDLGATYDVTDASGESIGWFRKDFRESLLVSTWGLGTRDGFQCVGRERNTAVAIVRRLWELVPVVGEIPVPWLFHFDFRGPDGSIVLSSTRKPAVRDVYDVRMPAVGAWRLDWRVAAAMAVALDALQGR